MKMQKTKRNNMKHVKSNVKHEKHEVKTNVKPNIIKIKT